jgi:hypothetical protein
MTKAVWKYLVPLVDHFELEMPVDAKPLRVQMQGGNVCMWALGTPTAAKVKKTFRVAGTGHAIDFSKGDLRFIDTFQVAGGQLVFHVFEEVE